MRYMVTRNKRGDGHELAAGAAAATADDLGRVHSAHSNEVQQSVAYRAASYIEIYLD